MTDSSPQSPAPWTLSGALSWLRQNRLAAGLLAAIVASLIWFFCFAKLYATLSLGYWLWLRWSPGYGMEHGKFVPLISLFLLWFHRRDLAKSAGPGSNHGLWIIGGGVLLYLIGARSLQARLALFSLPALLVGVTVYLWGWRTGRVVLFPACFLIFMIPLAALEQYTFRLQFLITNSVAALANLSGIHISTIGTSLRASDSAFAFEVDDGCSGIRSLFALSMLTALFVHFTQRSLWKKIFIFAMSVPFALIGNIGRILTILLCAKWFNPQIAGGLYHDYSAFLTSLPFSIGAMLGVSKLMRYLPDHFGARRAPEPLSAPSAAV